MVEVVVGGGGGAASPAEEGGVRPPDQDSDGPECDLYDLPFVYRLYSLAMDPYAKGLLANESAVLPFPVRSGDVTSAMQETVGRYMAEESPRMRGRVVLRSPNVPEPGKSPEGPHGPQDLHGPLSAQEFFGLHERFKAMIKAAAERDSMATPVTFELRDGDLLRPLPEGVASATRSVSQSRLLMDELGHGSFFDGVIFNGGYPELESLAPGSSDIEKIRRFLSNQDHRDIPGDLADAVFLERDYKLEPIGDPSQLRAGQKVVLVVDGGAISRLVGRSLEPTWNPMKWFFRLFRFGSLTCPSPSRQTPLLGAAQGYGHGPTEILLSHVASIRESTAERSALLAESAFHPFFREFFVTRLTEGPLMFSYICVEPLHSSMDDPPTFHYEVKPSGFRLYGLERKEKEVPPAV